ncbi:MAG: SDR family oxidoreductase [Candidatus Parabeggiatoa sp.]|nr:SDR family oxidoreductase [Candidatus Parabeggiatoa sp.]
MKALVTGGAGFIGSHLCELLSHQGHEVVVVDNMLSGSTKNIASIIESEKVSVHQVDIRDAQKLRPCFEGIDWVFHLAGLADIVPSIEHPDAYYSTNVTGTFEVLEACRAYGIKKIVYAASSSSYGIPDVYPTPETSPIKPQYPYALTKHLGEELILHWAQVYNIPAISLRLFNVYGIRSRTTGAYGAVFGVFLAQKLAGEPLTVVGDGTQTRDFTYVTDVANAFLSAAESDVAGKAMNVGSGGHYSVNQIVELLKSDSITIPKRPGEPECTFADITEITQSLGWKPKVSFVEGVKIMRENIENWREAPLWNADSIAQATASWFKYLGKNGEND